MMDWERVLGDLMEMYDYFNGCAVKAAPGSAARKRFTGYTQTLFNVVQEIKEMLDLAEDDGK